MRKIIKKIWKTISYYLIRFYIKEKDVFIINELENIPKYDFDNYSQFGQDAYVFDKIFNRKSQGIFVDVGGNEPIHSNNTYLFELNGWSGIAIEPQDNLRKLWIDTRKAECLDYVVGPEDKNISFVEGGDTEHGLAGVSGFNKVSESHKKEVIKKQKRLDEILKENNIKNVDFLSIDVEGYEMQVLNSIDFNTVNINTICIENNMAFRSVSIISKYIGSELGDYNLRKFLRNKSYKQVARIMCDDIFVKK